MINYVYMHTRNQITTRNQIKAAAYHQISPLDPMLAYLKFVYNMGSCSLNFVLTPQKKNRLSSEEIEFFSLHARRMSEF